MIIFVVAWAVLLYLIFSIALVITVKIRRRHDNPKLWKKLALFFVLLPVWDVLIAFIIYIPSALFWSGDTIHEYVETDTIHYDIYYKRMGVIEGTQNELFYKGFKYVEMDVKEIHLLSGLPHEGLYRFWLDKDRKIKYKKISEIGARYTVQQKRPLTLFILPIGFRKIDIIDRQENKIIASGKSVAISYLSFFGVPCFNWLHWYDQGEITVRANRDYYDIKEKVINSNQKRS